MPMFGKETKRRSLIANFGLEIYLKIEKEQQISPGDFPKLSKMQEILVGQDFAKFQTIKPKLLEAVEDMLANDIAKLMTSSATGRGCHAQPVC
uniref:DUF5600 domain-containing protein n=1 Tax=Anguilla anguilla TaxID=7936 RepID=A0A0E9RVX1_ANGAN